MSRSGTQSDRGVQVRNEPVQARAAARIDALLDAAATVIEDGGYETLTTALVAEQAGASIGTVYRYFPDRIALLLGLSARNLEGLRGRIELVFERDHETWVELVVGTLEALMSAYREIPSFRSLRTGDMLDLGEDGPIASTHEFAELTHRILVERYGVADDGEARDALLRGFMIADALVLFAFMERRDGDETLLGLARTLGLAEATAVIGDPRE